MGNNSSSIPTQWWKRHQYRLELSEKSRAREEAIDAGKIGPAIRSIVGKLSNSTELSWLWILDEGDMIMEPKKISDI